MTLRRTLALITAGLAGLAVALGTAQAQTVIKLGHVGDVDGHYDRPAKEFAKRVKERTGGKVEVQIFPASQLGSDKDLLQKMKLGQVDMFIPSTIMSSVADEFGVFEMPYIIVDRAHIERVWKELGDGVFRKAAEAKGVKILAFWENGFRHTTNNIRPIVTPEDLKGIKLRVPGGEWRVKMFKAYGANPSPMAFGEVFTALKTGVMDAQENPLINAWITKFYEVQKYLSLTGHVYAPAYLVTSPATFAKWPPDVQKIVSTAAVEMEAYSRKISTDYDNELLDKLKPTGIKVNEANKEAFIAGSKAIYEEYGQQVKGGAELIKKVQDLRK
jgi:tripartite ATP-independent transporter DctP family solute receptor